MNTMQIIILSLIQGVTEFLPISSSAHLILPSQLLGWPDQGLVFDAAVNLGTLLAVVLYLRKDLTSLIQHGCLSLIGKGNPSQKKLAWLIVLATIPAVVFGFILKKTGLDEDMRLASIIAATTLLFGVLMGIADRYGNRTKQIKNITIKHAILIGLSQAIALIPGTSRSGITITTALFLGFKREDAARFSFLLSVPITLGACLLVFFDLFQSNIAIQWNQLLMGTLISGISAIVCIHLFLGMISRIGLMPFVIYRLLLGGILVWLII